MKNFERWEKEVKAITSIGDNLALVKGKPAYCWKTECQKCNFLMRDTSCGASAINWLYAEYQENPEDKA